MPAPMITTRGDAAIVPPRESRRPADEPPADELLPAAER
jgi:hypothetical protein